MREGSGNLAAFNYCSRRMSETARDETVVRLLLITNGKSQTRFRLVTWWCVRVCALVYRI